MIAVSLNIGGGVRLIKPAKLYMCRQNATNKNEDGRTAPGVCGNDYVQLSHSGNVVSRIGIHTHGVELGKDSRTKKNGQSGTVFLGILLVL